MVAANKMFLTVLLLACISLQASAQEYCYQQNCRECEAKAEEAVGESVKCDLNNHVSISWLGQASTYSTVNTTSNTTAIEYSCIKMVAAKTNTDDNGDSTDVIKGCVLKGMAQSTCDALIVVEQNRLKEGNCYICEGNECNSSITSSGSILMLIITAVIARTFNY